MPKVVFLDVDGVLNSVKSFKDDARLEPKIFDRFFHPEHVEHLNEIIKRSDAKIVVSSAWRLDGLKKVTQHLRNAGVEADIIDVTDNVQDHRGNQIQRWLDKWNADHPHDLVTHFAIIDDDSDMVHLMPRLVHCNYLFGLQKQHVYWALSLLDETLTRNEQIIVDLQKQITDYRALCIQTMFAIQKEDDQHGVRSHKFIQEAFDDLQQVYMTGIPPKKKSFK